MDDKILNRKYNDRIFKKSIIAQQEAQQIVELFSYGGTEKLHTNFIEVKELMTCYRCALFEVETKFRVLDEQLSLQYERNPIDSINTRLKSPESIYEKIRRKNLPANIRSIEENLCDVAGVRVVCSFVSDVYMLAECLLKQDDVTLVEVKDYIKNPKPNGYRSLHLVIEIPIFLTSGKKMMKVEVQIRTVAMDLWAGLEHKIYYKKQLGDEKAVKAAQRLQRCAEMSAELDDEMQSIRNYVDGEDEKIIYKSI